MLYDLRSPEQIDHVLKQLLAQQAGTLLQAEQAGRQSATWLNLRAAADAVSHAGKRPVGHRSEFGGRSAEQFLTESAEVTEAS